MTADFDSKLSLGREIEMRVAAWLMRRGYLILPVYDYCGLSENKAPKLTAERGARSLVVPDLLCAREGASRWVEVKCKTSADWTFVTGRYETGIDLRLWRHYLEVERATGLPVWLVFVHRKAAAIAGQPASGAGMYGQSLAKLADTARMSPRFNNCRGGVFFDVARLFRVASLSDIGLDEVAA